MSRKQKAVSDQDAPVPMYAVSEVALDDLESIILGHVKGDNRTLAIGFIDAARENGPIPGNAYENGTIDRIIGERESALRQLDFLVGQINAAVQRMAGEIVARGFLSLQQSVSWANDELAKVQAGLAAIEQANQPKEE